MRICGDNRWIVPVISILLIALVVVPGCSRGRTSGRTPIHLNPDMDNQPRYEAQASSEFFENGAVMQDPVPGTVAQGFLRDDDALYRGVNSEGEFLKVAPVYFTEQRLRRGEERFNIYCSPCHSRIGDGRGIMVNRGYVPPPSFHTDRIRKMPDGQIFDVITNGVRNMPSYRNQIPPDDRWSIVAYLRVLQRAQNASIEDIPVELRDKVK